jgi:ATP-dependent RNA helicase SUPV3L1/SUV3
MRYISSKANVNEAFDFVDRYWTDMSIADRLMLIFAPVPWRDKITAAIVIRFLNMHSSSMTVDFMEAIYDTGFLQTMLAVENDMDSKEEPQSNIDTMMRLESFHKVIVFYIWMSLRSPVVYSEYLMVSDLKIRLEKVLNWSLEALSMGQNPRGVVPHRPMASAKYMSQADARSLKNKSRQRPAMAFNPTETQKVASSS